MRRIIIRLDIERDRRSSSIIEQLADLIAKDEYLNVYDMQTGDAHWLSDAAWRDKDQGGLR